MRRALDIIVALVGGILASPVTLAVALLVLLYLGRPIFFVQVRSGQGGKPFHLVKFRSMSHATARDGRPLSDAMRLTRFGRILRRSRLDELPELWNVLNGGMSLIGPRPLLAPTIAAMGADGILRGTVRPGLTGWAQVSGNADLSDPDKLALDLWYIENRSLPLDLAILWGTVGLMLFGDKVDARRVEAARRRRS